MNSIQAPNPSALINEFFTPAYLTASLFRSLQRPNSSRGNGERVLVWPGFGASNASTVALRAFLQSLGYKTEGWQLGRNSADVQATLEELKTDVMARPEPVILVGWSLGGYLAREVARDCPDRVSQVVTLGSPVVGGPKYTAIASTFNDSDGALDEIERLVEERYETPLEVPVTAIYSKSDGVVAWQACIDHRSPNVNHIEVVTSHTGFGFDANVLKIVADQISATNTKH